jgi:tetratricopeptide (TPR) repeat protein
MKLKHQILIFSVVSMLIANVAIAQKQPSRKELSAPQIVPSLSKPEVQKLIKEELEKEESKNEVKIRERVQIEVDRSFGWTMRLIQFLLAVLAVLPILAGLFLFLLRNSIKNQIVEAAKDQIKEKLDTDVKTALEEFDKRLNLETVKKTDEIILEVKKRMADLLAEATKSVEKTKDQAKEKLEMEVKTALKEIDRVKLETINKTDELILEVKKVMADLLAEAEKIKDDVVEEMSRLVPEASVKGAVRESIDPVVLAKVQELTTTLKGLQDRYPELILTADDYVKKGDALFYETSYKEALDAYERAIKLKPDEPDAWTGKGSTLGQLQYPKEALAAYNKAIELKPDSLVAWLGKGIALGELQRPEEAIAAYNKAIELKPDDLIAWYNKACLHSLNGNAKLAIQNLKRSIEINAIHREMAKTDSDFDNIRDDQEFKQLIEDV